MFPTGPARQSANAAPAPKRFRRRGISLSTRLAVLLALVAFLLGSVDIVRVHGLPPALEHSMVASELYAAWPEMRDRPELALASGEPPPYWRRAGLRMALWLAAPLLILIFLRTLLSACAWVIKGALPWRR